VGISLRQKCMRSCHSVSHVYMYERIRLFHSLFRSLTLSPRHTNTPTTVAPYTNWQAYVEIWVHVTVSHVCTCMCASDSFFFSLFLFVSEQTNSHSTQHTNWQVYMEIRIEKQPEQTVHAPFQNSESHLDASNPANLQTVTAMCLHDKGTAHVNVFFLTFSRFVRLLHV